MFEKPHLLTSEVKSSEKTQSEETVSRIESTANYEGNYSILLFSRLRNPIIMSQLVDLYYGAEMELDSYYKNETFTFDQVFKDGKVIMKDTAGRQLLETQIRDFKPRTKGEIQAEIEERISHVERFTEIDFNPDKQPDELTMAINWKYPYTGEKPDTRTMSLIEAHEKGHRIRPFRDSYFKAYFSGAFDESCVVLTDEDIRVHGDILEESGEKEITPDEVREIYTNYLFSAREIVERMSQLKNYFGMNANESFTADHLAYVRKNYVRDIGMDNGITHMLQAVTREREEEFLRLINSSGI